MSKRGETIERCELSEVKPFRLGPTREGLIVRGELFDVTRVALSAGLGYHTAITPAVWKAYVRELGPIAGDTPDERLWTLLHSLWVTHRNEAPESNEATYDFGGNVPVRAVSMPRRVITVLLADEEIPFVTPEAEASDSEKADMPSVVLTAVERVIEYLWDDERVDFLATAPESRKGHIFASLLVLRNWRDEETQDYSWWFTAG